MTAGDGPYRGDVDHLGAKRARFRLGTRLTGWDVLGATLGLVCLATGDLVTAAMAGTTGVANWFARRGTRHTIEVHAGGLRAPTCGPDLPWDDVTDLGYDGTRGQRVITLGRRAGPALVLPAAPEALLDTIEAAVVPRQLEELRDRLARGLAIEVGKYHLDLVGMSGPRAALPWEELGPARRGDHRLVIEASIGPFAIALANVVNPGAVIALIGELGRPARPAGAP